MFDRHGKPLQDADRLFPWEWHTALRDAQRARWRFQSGLLLTGGRTLKLRFCGRIRKMNIRLCPLCC